MTQENANSGNPGNRTSNPSEFGSSASGRADRSGNRSNPAPSQTTYYAILGLHPSASVRDIRQAYRDLSKRYHPDTTTLPATTATAKFQQLNEAYATLSNLDRRLAYDHKIGYSQVVVSQPLSGLGQTQSATSSAYLDATDRPFSAGEWFALFILGVTFLGCLMLALTIGLTKGEEAFKLTTTWAQQSPSALEHQQSGELQPDVIQQVAATIASQAAKMKAQPRATPSQSSPSGQTSRAIQTQKPTPSQASAPTLPPPMQTNASQARTKPPSQKSNPQPPHSALDRTLP